MRKAINLLICFLLVLLTASLAGAAWAVTLDPDIFTAFRDPRTSNKLAVDFANTPLKLWQMDKDFLCIQQRLLRTPMDYKIAEFLNDYDYDAEGDPLARKYVAIAKARGNVVKSYKPPVNQIIFKNFRHPATNPPTTGKQYRSNLDRALIEFDQSGRIVSFMSRLLMSSSNVLNTEVVQYTTIYLGPKNARALENVLSNRVLEENFLREF